MVGEHGWEGVSVERWEDATWRCSARKQGDAGTRCLRFKGVAERRVKDLLVSKEEVGEEED